MTGLQLAWLQVWSWTLKSSASSVLTVCTLQIQSNIVALASCVPNRSLLSVPLLFLHLTSYSWKQFEVCLNVSFIWDYSTWCAWLAQLFYCRTNNTCLSQINTQSCGWCVVCHLHLQFWIWVSKSTAWSPRHLLMLYPAYHSTAATANENSFSFTGASTFLFSEVQHNPTAHHTGARRPVQSALLASSSAGDALKKKQVVDRGQEMRQCESFISWPHSSFSQAVK
jgi:hypothetical protein